MNFSNTKMSKSIDSIINGVRSRLFICQLNAGDRNALYFEYKEWLEKSSEKRVIENIAYCKYFNDLRDKSN